MTCPPPRCPASGRRTRDVDGPTIVLEVQESARVDARFLVDATVLVYAFDSSAGHKQRVAQALLERLWESSTGCVSVQVLQEFFVTVTRKVAKPLPAEDAKARIRELKAWKLFAPSADDVLAAIDLQGEARIGFWDALIVLAAAESGCDVLWTEDLSDGQHLRGVRIRNPFAGEP